MESAISAIARQEGAGEIWISEILSKLTVKITADLPANTQFLSPRLYLNTGATAAAVAYDCAGLYLETDY